MIGGLQRAFGGVEQLTHVAVLHLLEVAQLEDRALNVGQRGDGFLKLCLDLRAVEVVIGHQAVGYRRLLCADSLLFVASQEIQTR